MSATGNKIHIYSVQDFKLKHCLGNEIPINQILNLAFSKKNKFLSLLFDDLSIQIYNLTKVKDKDICQCVNDSKQNQSIFSGFFSSVKVS